MLTDEFDYGDRFDQKLREATLTVENLWINTEEPFKLIYGSRKENESGKKKKIAWEEQEVGKVNRRSTKL